MNERDNGRIPIGDRVVIYTTLTKAITSAWKKAGHTPLVALCKEPKELRREVGLLHGECNCCG